MPDLHSLPEGTRPENAIRNNGPDVLALERFKIRELAEGWPAYRDAREWANFRSIFRQDAYVYTTWSGRVHVDDFIKASQAGMDRGAQIMHRCHGATVDITPDGARAVCKLKATISQRFSVPRAGSEGGSVGASEEDVVEVDCECDCRFCFFFEKLDGRWGARFVRLWYEKDKVIPVDGVTVPRIDGDKLRRYPAGYRYLAYFQASLSTGSTVRISQDAEVRLGLPVPFVGVSADPASILCSQELTMGVSVKLDMPGARGPEHDRLYAQCKAWLDGEEVDI